MQFEVEFYISATGRNPVWEGLQEIRWSDPDEHMSVLTGLERLEQRCFHREPLSKPLGSGIFEMRHKGRLNVRLLWFFMTGRRIIVVHMIRHKAQAIPRGEILVAQERMNDWLRRHA